MMLFKMGMTDDVGDYWGNFAGDLAWTIEPFIILFVAPLISRDNSGVSESSSGSRISRSKIKTLTDSRGRSKSNSRKKKAE